VSGGGDGAVYLWDFAKGALKQRLVLAEAGVVRNILVIDDDLLAVTIEGYAMRILNFFFSLFLACYLIIYLFFWRYCFHSFSILCSLILLGNRWCFLRQFRQTLNLECIWNSFLVYVCLLFVVLE
jgi:hypothetical protein